MPRSIGKHKPPRFSGPQQSHREYDLFRRDPEARRFYNSAAWKRVRLLKLQMDPLCEECLLQNLTTPATQVHHKKERRDHPELALDLDNL